MQTRPCRGPFCSRMRGGYQSSASTSFQVRIAEPSEDLSIPVEENTG